MMQRQATRRAFTLIELAIVVAIVALLVGLLIPALGTARQSSIRTICQSSQRQIGAAMAAYTQDYRGRLPIAYYWLDSASQPTAATTPHMVRWDTITDHGEVRPGLIWRYATDYAVQQCPSYVGASNTFVPEEHTGYNYNTTYIGRGVREGVWGGMTEAPAAIYDLADPQRTAMVGDGGYKGGANKYMRSPTDASPNGAGFVVSGSQAYRHLDTTNVTWADGHVTNTAVRHAMPGASDQTLDLQDWPHNGFLSADASLYDRR